MFRDAFGLIVSEGALMNMFIRSHAGFKIEADKAKAILRQAKVVASDENRRADRGDQFLSWVSIARTPWCISPIIACRPCRGRDDERPYAERLDFGSLLRAAKAWRRTSNLFGASGARHGLCAGAWIGRSALRFKLWFGKAFDLARDIASFAASTIASKKRELEKQLAALLAAATECDLARQLQAKIGRAQDQL